MVWHLRPVSGEYGAAVGVEFDLPDGCHSSALQAELDAADAGEQGEDVEAHDRLRSKAMTCPTGSFAVALVSSCRAW